MKSRFTTLLYTALLVFATSFGSGLIGKDSPWRDQAASAATLFGPGTTPYAHVIVVAKSGGDYATISSALSSITDNSTDSRYLVWVAPGTYDERLTMKPYVDIQGAGEDVSTIRSAGDEVGAGTVTGASNAEIRYLTVQNVGGNAYATAFDNDNASPRLSHLTLLSSGATSTTTGMYSSNNSAPTLDNVQVVVSGSAAVQGIFYFQCLHPFLSDTTISVTGLPGATLTYGVTTSGVFNSSSKLTLRNVKIDVTGSRSDVVGVYAAHSSLNVLGSTIEGRNGSSNTGIAASGLTSESTNILVNDSVITASSNTITSGSGATVRVGATHLAGGPVFVSGAPPPVKCAGVYDENYNFYASTCP